MKLTTEKLKCSNCSHEWVLTSGGYDRSINSSAEYFNLLQEQQARVCPKCGDDGHLPLLQRGLARSPRDPATSAEPSKEAETGNGDWGEFTARKPRFSLEKDVVLSATSQGQIEESLAKIRFRHTIYHTWGFSQVDPMGKGAILNFYGKPGTGKTLAAEAMAGTLGMPILNLGMADVESKFMGDTAKNIRKAFAASLEQGALLFFDEADTLLGKRLSCVTQGVDNEVNAQRSTLLMELERFDGIVIFASNFAENYDKAFESRITQHIRFDLPDLSTRTSLWLKHLVPQIPTAEPREELADRAAEQSEGLVGRDIRNSLRLALPKALLEQERVGGEVFLRWEHLSEAIAQIREAHREVGQEVNARTDQAQFDAARQFWGLQKSSKDQSEIHLKGRS